MSTANRQWAMTEVDISVGELDHVGVQKGFVDRLIRAALTKAGSVLGGCEKRTYFQLC